MSPQVKKLVQKHLRKALRLPYPQQKSQGRVGGKIQQLNVHTALAEVPSSVPTMTKWLTTTCNSRGSKSLFLPWRALHSKALDLTQIYTQT